MSEGDEPVVEEASPRQDAAAAAEEDEAALRIQNAFRSHQRRKSSAPPPVQAELTADETLGEAEALLGESDHELEGAAEDEIGGDADADGAEVALQGEGGGDDGNDGDQGNELLDDNGNDEVVMARDESVDDVLAEQAATTIQAHFRGYRQRREYLSMLEERHESQEEDINDDEEPVKPAPAKVLPPQNSQSRLKQRAAEQNLALGSLETGRSNGPVTRKRAPKAAVSPPHAVPALHYESESSPESHGPLRSSVNTTLRLLALNAPEFMNEPQRRAAPRETRPGRRDKLRRVYARQLHESPSPDPARTLEARNARPGGGKSPVARQKGPRSPDPPASEPPKKRGKPAAMPLFERQVEPPTYLRSYLATKPAAQSAPPKASGNVRRLAPLSPPAIQSPTKVSSPQKRARPEFEGRLQASHVAPVLAKADPKASPMRSRIQGTGGGATRVAPMSDPIATRARPIAHAARSPPPANSLASASPPYSVASAPPVARAAIVREPHLRAGKRRAAPAAAAAAAAPSGKPLLHNPDSQLPVHVFRRYFDMRKSPRSGRWRADRRPRPDKGLARSTADRARSEAVSPEPPRRDPPVAVRNPPRAPAQQRPPPARSPPMRSPPARSPEPIKLQLRKKPVRTEVTRRGASVDIDVYL